MGTVRGDKGKGREMCVGGGDMSGIVPVGHVHCVYKSVNLGILSHFCGLLWLRMSLCVMCA